MSATEERRRRRTPRRRRVLHSMPAPGGQTRYANHMAALDGPEFEMSFFTWPTALWGRYDVFHLHWPEQLLGREKGLTGWLRSLLAGALLLRLRLGRVPVVHTVHNHTPHDRQPSRRLARLTERLARLTRLEIHLVPEPQHVTAAPVAVIPHGDYRTPFASYPKQQSVPGRLVFFGLIKRYKGVETLVHVFERLASPELELRIVGAPEDPAVTAVVDAAARTDPRVTRRYAFVPDAELVDEVSRAQLVILPYEEFHSSGAVLVALSLDRPVLVPASPTTEALREEVGGGWVHLYQPPLTPEAVERALGAASATGRPNLEARRWPLVRDAHTAAYLRVLGEPNPQTPRW